MTDISTVEQLADEMRAQLAPGAVIEITPAREPGLFNVWVVGSDASSLVQQLIERAASEVQNALNSVQVFDTPEEAERLGVPLASALARRTDWATRTNPAVHADQLAIDFDKLEPTFERPLVVSFYSFRGGVGRTTALAHTAAALARRGRRVVIVDADLEAPGIHHVFGLAVNGASPFLDLLSEIQRSPNGTLQQDIRDYLTPVIGLPDLYLLSAGDPSPRYLDALNGLQLRSWTLGESNPMTRAIDAIATSALDPDVILIDARTGFTDTNATVLLGASDHVVIVFYPSEQSQAGTALVAGTLRRAPGRRGYPLGLHFVASPLPPGPGEQTHSDIMRRGRTWAAEWLSPAAGDVDDADFVAVPYEPAFALTDRLVTDDVLLEPYRIIADWIDPGAREEERKLLQYDVARVRHELQFSAGNSDDTHEDIRRLFVRTIDAERLLDRRIMIVEGRKGTGKTTLFRWLSEEHGAIPITAPERLRQQVWWPTREVWPAIARSDPDFRVAWPLLIALRTVEAANLQEPAEVLDLLQVARAGEVSGLVAAVEKIAATRDAPLTAIELMFKALSALGEPSRLVFDGLDTSFGYSLDEQEIRDRAIGALLPLLVDREASLPDISFTVFLRTDILQGISFANQSHLFGRQLTLRWDKQDYLKTVLKQALSSSPSFALFAEAQAAEVDSITEDQTLQIWYSLVGIRVRGKQTAFTDRWVWSRLADGNGDHSPRHLAQFFRALAERARSREPDAAGFPLRARDFGFALSDVVSAEALTAVKDEFASDVDRVLQVFERIDESPFALDQWLDAGGDSDALSLARTMGLVAVHPRERDRLVVPELYRYALKVRRRGPA